MPFERDIDVVACRRAPEEVGRKRNRHTGGDDKEHAPKEQRRPIEQGVDQEVARGITHETLRLASGIFAADS
jgi:hypothetical protein